MVGKALKISRRRHRCFISFVILVRYRFLTFSISHHAKCRPLGPFDRFTPYSSAMRVGRQSYCNDSISYHIVRYRIIVFNVSSRYVPRRKSSTITVRPGDDGC